MCFDKNRWIENTVTTLTRSVWLIWDQADLVMHHASTPVGQRLTHMATLLLSTSL